VNWRDPLRLLYWVCLVTIAAWIVQAHQSAEWIARMVGHV